MCRWSGYCMLSEITQTVHTPAVAPPHPDLKYPLVGHVWHAWQAADPWTSAYVPGGQSAHSEDPVAFAKVPLAQPVHGVVKPVALPNVPLAQLKHADNPVVLPNVPTGQVWHSDESTAENVPTGHGTHWVLMASLTM